MIYCALWSCSQVQTITHVLKKCTEITFDRDIKQLNKGGRKTLDCLPHLTNRLRDYVFF